MQTTKREILFSIAIVCVMLVIGIIISNNISNSMMDKYQEYNTALQIDNDRELFEYGMRTNIGNAFVYGELKAIDPVTYPEIGGEYSYVEKVKERYTKHTRTVTKTKTVNGKTKHYTEQEDYWTWDQVDSESIHSEKISFLDVEFDYGKIPFPGTTHISTIKESSRIRYQYYATDTNYVGTLYTVLADDTINNTNFYNKYNIQESIEYLESEWALIVFWIFWILLTVACVGGFCCLDNRWLEDNYY